MLSHGVQKGETMANVCLGEKANTLMRCADLNHLKAKVIDLLKFRQICADFTGFHQFNGLVLKGGVAVH